MNNNITDTVANCNCAISRLTIELDELEKTIQNMVTSVTECLNYKYKKRKTKKENISNAQ